ncbi:FxSxx-COOH system tetratricopeptide repeat protein [Actinoplanes sp. NPDC049265]|uniref:FxSxx-COOH system tetratricopeptide repeat protein n=1 Tax=Actinoplanes sp. NPDC049265 TaxID=3363902 RepID=UPI003715EA7A
MAHGARKDAAGDLRNALIDALVDVPFVDRRADRRLLINLIRREVNEFPDVPERDESRLHVIEIVLACMAARGGLRALRGALSVMAPRAPGAKRVDQLIKAATLSNLLLEGEVQRTHELLDRAETHGASVDWWLADVAGLTPPAPPPASSLGQAFDHAAGRNHHEYGTIAGLIMIDRVAARLDGPIRVELVGWTEQIADRLEVTDQLLSARPSDIVPRKPETESQTPPSDLDDVDEVDHLTVAEVIGSPEKALFATSGDALQTQIDPVEVDTRLDSDASTELGDEMPPVAETRRSHDRLPQVWGDIPQRNQEFTGREDLLARLHDELVEVRETAVLPEAIHGMGGVGKSQLAIEYVHRHSREYDLVWWVPAEQQGQILNSLTALAQRLGLDVSPEANSAVPAVKEALSTGQTGYENWLLVFDNAEDPAEVRQFFPTGGAGKIIVTSRNPEWGRGARPLEVDVFNRAESTHFLTKRNPDLTDDEADRLAEALGDLPLAIEQASAWHATTGMPAGEYLELLDEKRLELLDQEPPPDYRVTVRAAWRLSLERLREVNLGALQLLQVCSFFAPEPISRKLFAGSPTAPITDDLDATLSDKFRLSRAIRDIQRYALAKIDHRNNTLQIHRLIRLVLDDSMDADQQALMRRGAHTLLANGNPSNPSRSDEWPRYGALRPHLNASRAVESDDARVQELVAGMARYLYYWGDHVGSEQLAEEALRFRQADRGPNDPHTLRLAKWVGWMYFVNGKFAQARDLNQDTLQRYQQTFGDEDEGTLDAMWVVATDLRVAGDFEAARELDETAVRTGRRVLGDDDPALLIGTNNLALSLRLLGRYTEALELDTDTEHRRAVVLGSDDELTLSSMSNRNVDLREAGHYLEARNRQEKLFSTDIELFGRDAPATLKTARILAVMRRKAGDHNGALKLSLETLERYLRRYDENFPEAIATAINLAIDHRHANNLTDARKIGEQTVAAYHRLFGPRHLYTLSARTNLAIVLRHAGDPAAAREHNEESLRILEETLGRDHPVALITATNFASDLAAQGELAMAYDLDTDTLSRSERVLGVEHPSTLACSVNLALDLRQLNRVAEADRILADTMIRLRRVLGERHPATLNALQNLRADCDVDPMPM